MRQRYKPWADDFLMEHQDLIIQNPAEQKGRWQSLFANKQSLHLEVGTGKGQFLVGMAKQHPDINFIGMEVAKSVVVTAGEKALEAEMDNLLLVHADANHLLDYFAEDEISTIYLNFSDPWPKNRHEKRRLTYTTFLKQYEHILQQEGELIFKTDNRGLFEYSLCSFSAYDMLLKEVNLDLHAEEDPLNVMTEYEEKFSAKGHPIYRCKAVF
ncbi:tRNA (guanosine(46)-N7)-methyltransferase TrmB [Oceanobacillus alkalisoli]|uniref:tRNA (guanosine(46)-N7)-methyltransferase TrmB n=1 Tax=Oceanobacillus alkalisoli TaxID=2925113 RepID=UPI001EF01AA3|nr:tRNA (guanosine(46)-N7)-methyltransferase TrmB [Oceanobacillus alkalisoli]MCF3944959.1 tRNA (guanosine(46)-N7)-methyltransferase TrmB [Oceanobacillus alkalisoli]MCG5105239.1 tRNA (guanosine(46)-N7)-methyltransferase TrmB [Oceanobacillus alkalisoli]